MTWAKTAQFVKHSVGYCKYSRLEVLTIVGTFMAVNERKTRRDLSPKSKIASMPNLRDSLARKRHLSIRLLSKARIGKYWRPQLGMQAWQKFQPAWVKRTTRDREPGHGLWTDRQANML